MSDPNYPNYYEANFTYRDEDYEGKSGVLWNKISHDVYGRDDLAYIIKEHNPDLSEDNKNGFGLVTNVSLRIPEIDFSTFPTANTPDWRQAADLETEL